jgi:hypothetical protein
MMMTNVASTFLIATSFSVSDPPIIAGSGDQGNVVDLAASSRNAFPGTLGTMDTPNRGPGLPQGLYRAVKWLCLALTFVVVAVFGTLGYNLGSAYYAGMAGFVLPLGAYVLIGRVLRAAEIRARARYRWGASGRHVETEQDEAGARDRRRYLEWTAIPAGATVDERTWTDLAMDEVYREMNVCFTEAGRNELYRLLHHCLPSESEVEERERLVQALHADAKLRVTLLTELSGVGQEKDANAASFLWGQDINRERLEPLHIGMAIAAAASIVSVFVLGTTGLLLVAATFVTNMVLYYGKERHLTSLIPSLRLLSRTMTAAGRIAAMAPPVPGVDVQALRTRIDLFRRLKRPFRWLLTGASARGATLSGDLFEIISIYLRIFFAVDLVAYDRIVAVLSRETEAARDLYRLVGRLDALCAVGSYRVHRSDQQPFVHTPRAGIEATMVYHPLLERPVANTVTIPPPGAVVTGTNMAGKSTFLRTLGINTILAQTTGSCFARSWRADRFLVMSSIEKGDDTAAGKSFYYEEAERIFRMIEHVGSDIPVLLLIDELLSGTNSLERASASVAILRYLARRNAVTVAATHDVAIPARLGPLYGQHYFTDQAAEDGLHFDYRLRPGIVGTRNALRLLAMIGYPDDLVEEAMREAAQGS